MPDPITDDLRPELIRVRIEAFYRTVDTLAGNLRSGRITLGMWQEEMKTQIRMLHTGAAVIGRGGEDAWANMTSQEWGRLGPIVREQYSYLARFAQDIYDRREAISEAQIAWRARLYGDKAAFSAMIIQSGDIAQFLPYMPKGGDTECGNHCRCSWVLTTGEPLDGMKLVTAVWTLHPAEHCRTCIDRDRFEVQFTVPEEWDVPVEIGGY